MTYKAMFKNPPARYVSGWWLSSCAVFVTLALVAASEILQWRPLQLASNYLLVLFGVSLLGLFSVAVWNLIRRRWKLGIVHLVSFFVWIGVSFAAFSYLIMASMFGPSEDHFAATLTIPDNIEVAVPQDWKEEPSSSPEDEFGTVLLAELNKPGSDDATVKSGCSVFTEIAETASGHPQALFIHKCWVACVS